LNAHGFVRSPALVMASARPIIGLFGAFIVSINTALAGLVEGVCLGGLPLIQSVPDLGHVPRQQFMHTSDRAISDAGEDLLGKPAFHPNRR